jgi:hypothetical protein
LIGALIVTFSVIGFGEASRAARWINLALGAWLLVAPWLLSGQVPMTIWNDVAVGLTVMLLSVRRGRIEERFGGWDKFVV